MSYDAETVDVAQLQENVRAAKAETDSVWNTLDRLRSRLREIVPDVPEGGDLVAAVQRKIDGLTAVVRAAEARAVLDRTTVYVRRDDGTVIVRGGWEEWKVTVSAVEAVAEAIQDLRGLRP